jgi:multimeric flavodoxin WrbA
LTGVHVLGVSASPRANGGTSVLVQAALLGAHEVAETTTEYVTLAGKTVHPCDGCIACLKAGRCVLEDDMQPLYEKLLAADVILIGSPAYFGSASSLCKAFMERVEGFGVSEKKLRLKIGGVITTAGSRNGGQETAAIGIQIWMHVNDMLPVGITTPVAQWGVTGNTGFDAEDVHRDVIRFTPWPAELGTPSRAVESMLSKELAWIYGRKLATVATIVQAGLGASGLDLPDKPYGWNLPTEYPPELYEIGRPT